MIVKSCCFIGHRKIEITDGLKKEVREFVEDLIVKENVKRFLFGSKSEFDSFCHAVVTELREKYPDIKRIGYTCKSETVTLENVREEREKGYSELMKRKISLLGMEEEFEHKTKYTAGKAAYVERNQAMIDDSDFCLFYYNKDYKVPTRRRVSGLGEYRPNSGTEIAYKYAERKKKKIKNFYKE